MTPLLCSFLSLIFVRIEIKSWNFLRYKVYLISIVLLHLKVFVINENIQEDTGRKFIYFLPPLKKSWGIKIFLSNCFSVKNLSKNELKFGFIAQNARKLFYCKNQICIFWHQKCLPDFQRYPGKWKEKII